MRNSALVLSLLVCALLLAWAGEAAAQPVRVEFGPQQDLSAVAHLYRHRHRWVPDARILEAVPIDGWKEPVPPEDDPIPEDPTEDPEEGSSEGSGDYDGPFGGGGSGGQPLGAQVPEPATITILGLGALALLWRKRR